MIRLSARIRGAVQGVGFRPFVYRLALENSLTGWVKNSPSGVETEVEGSRKQVERFVESLKTDRPPMAVIQSMELKYLKPAGYKKFEIRESSSGEDKAVLVSPDIAMCGECMNEINAPNERRFNYPFTNCTNCGPRYTITERLPYDRANTTMSIFKMCKDCRKEYDDPKDRRFHAQPIACPACGPKIFLTNGNGKKISERRDALSYAAQKIRDGSIVALKGLGGFLLVCDARNHDAVRRLRSKKYREEKPLAVMYTDMKSVKGDCKVSDAEEDILLSPQSPIVLLKKSDAIKIAENIAPSNPYLGVMLPYTPLHHLLMKELGFPVVATSGNKTDDPIAIGNDEALDRLRNIADYFLLHDRPILRRVDDSVVRVAEGKLLMLRRARGYAPLPVYFHNPSKKRVLALGGHLKSTISFSKDDNVFVSQHIGDLETYEAIESFKEVISSLGGLYDFTPETIAVDMHPNYTSTKIGEELSASMEPAIGMERVQHHHAHIASCMCENGLDGTVLGVAWDGTGYGTDGQAWGSEFLVSDYRDFERYAHFLPLPLPGGEAAIRKSSHSALGVLYTVFGNELSAGRFSAIPTLKEFSGKELDVLVNSMKSNFNSPPVYGAGRLFDAVSSILGIRQECSFEGQAAMQLEFEGMAAQSKAGKGSYKYELKSGKPMVIDWRPMVREIVEDCMNGADRRMVSFKFHQTLAKMIFDIAEQAGNRRVVLSGGVFQNTLLLSLVDRLFNGSKFKIYTHSMLPPNDGCVSVGQAAIAIARSG